MSNDPRFNRMRFDPKFKQLKKKENKVKLDKRFNNMLDDKRFMNPNVNDTNGKIEYNKDFVKKNYYKENESEKEDEEDSNNSESFVWDEESSEDSNINEEEIANNNEIMNSEEEENFIEGDSSSCLSLINYNWMNFKSNHIFALFQSFCGDEGKVLWVKEYQSEYGKKLIEEENANGPLNLIKTEYTKLKESNDKNELRNWVVDETITNMNKINEIRKYENNRLKYYYSIILFDSKKTAEKVFEEMDGKELENSGIQIDLRYVHLDQIKFPYEPTDKCDKLRKIDIDEKINSKALNHTKLELTWDKEEFKNTKNLFDKELDEINDDEIKEILGDYDEDEENDENYQLEINNKKKKIENLMKNQDRNSNKDFDKKGRSSKEIVITFKNDFGQIEEDIEEPLDNFTNKKFNDKKIINLKSKKNNSKKKKFNKKNNDELELLVDNNKKEEDFKVNREDIRFKKLFKENRKEYHVDPTDKNYKKNK